MSKQQSKMSHQDSDSGREELEEGGPAGVGGRSCGGRGWGRPTPEPPVNGAVESMPMRGRGHARGRPPMFSRAMTPAEKMRRSRERKREAMGDEAYAALMKIKYKEYRVSIK